MELVKFFFYWFFIVWCIFSSLVAICFLVGLIATWLEERKWARKVDETFERRESQEDKEWYRTISGREV